MYNQYVNDASLIFNTFMRPGKVRIYELGVLKTGDRMDDRAGFKKSVQKAKAQVKVNGSL